MNIKRNIKALLVLFLFLGAVSCDKIEPPFMNEVSNDNDDDTEVVRKILLEVFTGHLCPNCPAGKEAAEELKTLYGDRLIIMSIHTGIFARPIPDGFENDYRTAEGEAIATAFGVNQYPVGMVNRESFDGSAVLSPSAFGSAVSESLLCPPPLRIGVNSSYDTSSRQLEIDFTLDIIIEQEGPHYLSVFLLEDGIVSPQKTDNPDYSDGVIEDYEHNHMLRTAINGTWGEVLCTESLPANDSFFKSYSRTLCESISHENAKVVAFVYNGNSMEIIQAEVQAIVQ